MNPTEDVQPGTPARPTAAPPSPDDPRLVQALEEYAAALQAGQRPDRHEFQARYPEIAAALGECLEGLEFVRAAAPLLQPPAAAAELCPEGPLGDYRLVREIGRGGMGVVYEAVQISLGRRVALKVLPFAAALDGQHLQRFKNEAQAAAHLHHQHIVPVHGVGCERGVHYYAMQYIDGQSLAELIAARRQAPRTQGPALADAPREDATDLFHPSEQVSDLAAAQVTPRPVARLSTEVSANSPAFFRTAASLGVQAAEGLEHAHQMGVIHRDVKPANLLLDGRGNVWITDFGLAHCQSQAGLTMTGDLVGTLRYMSPEQALAQRAVIDHRTDVYSLGATLYELLTLEPVFAGSDRQELLRQIASEEPKPPRRWNKAIPAELETILLKALEKNPAARYATAQELADDLGRFLKDEPIRARRPSLLQRAWKWARRHRPVLTALLAAGGLALLAALAAGIWFTLRLQGERDNARAQEKIAAQERDHTGAEYDKGRRHLYAAHLHLARLAWQDGEIARARDLLDGEGCPPDLRGWEWHYLRRCCRINAVSFRGPAEGVGNIAFGTPAGQFGGVRWQGPAEGIGNVAFSPDGRWLAAVHDGGRVLLWDLTSGRQVGAWQGPRSPAGIAFREDGRRLVVAEVDGALQVWDTATGREVGAFTRLEATDGPVSLSPDGRRVAVGTKNRTVTLRDTATGRECLTLGERTTWITSLAFSQDGRLLAVAKMDKTVQLWDAVRGQALRTISGLEGNAYSLAFSPDGTLLALIPREHTGVTLWDVASGQARATLQGPAAYGRRIGFSPDGRQLAATGFAGTALLWDVASGRQTLTLGGYAEPIWTVAFHPNGRQLATSANGTVRLWDLASRPKQVRTLVCSKGHGLAGVAFSPDGRELVAVGSGSLSFWDTVSGRPTRTLRKVVTVLFPHAQGPRPGPTASPLFSVVFSPDGRWLAAGDGTGQVFLWEAASGREVRSLPGLLGPLPTPVGALVVSPVFGVAFSPDSRLLAAGCGRGCVKVWNVAAGQEVHTLWGQTPSLGGFAFDPGGRLLALARADGSVKIWDAATGQERHTLEGHRGAVCGVAFSPDGKHLATGSWDRTVKLWDTDTGTEVRTFAGHADRIQAVAFSPDGRRIASAGNDQTVKLWDAESGLETLTLKGQAPFSAVRFSPDGRQLAAADQDGAVSLWDTATDDGAP